MKYPAFNEYQAAIQNPSRCLTPSGLQRCKVESDLWGLPRVRSGGFALTYKLSDGNSTWAVRCFHKHVADREERYQAINQFLNRSRLDYLEPVQFIKEGISIKGNRYPITFMRWVEGETLEAWIIRHLDQPQLIEEMSVKFYRLVYDLEKYKITHGDLSHQNIMIRDSKLVLVDYDGMNVPEMKQRFSCEIGHPNFQHPGRDESIFDLTTDRFSSIVIYLALRALSIDPKFWNRYETGGEGLLFTRTDFEKPFQSPLLQEMETIAGLNRDVRLFRQVCLSDVHYVPTLDEFVNGLGLDLLVETGQSKHIEPEKPVVLDASRKYLFSTRLGQKVTIAGKIEEVFSGKSRDDVPHVFLNFGNWKLKCFTIVLWDDALSLMQSAGITPQDFLDKWVCVTGMLTAYRRRPQIIVNTPYDIEILDEDRVNERLIASGTFRLTDLSNTSPIRSKNSPTVSLTQAGESLSERDQMFIEFEEVSAPNPLDISTTVADRINDLYRKKEKPKRTRKPDHDSSH